MRRWLRVATMFCLCLCLCLVLGTSGLLAQRQRKPQRAVPPKFSGKEFAGTFFEDVSSVLQGARPSAHATPEAAPGTGSAGTGPAGTSSATPSQPLAAQAAGSTGGSTGWAKLISAATIEDTVKNSKLRLDQIVASPTKFSGGYVEARREFSLQALMFAIIEQYSGDVRWKHSAAVAREAMSRMAANAKVSSPQAHKEAKQRVLDLDELLNGNSLQGTASSELVWANVIDRVPLMQLLEWAHKDHINGYTSSKENFEQHKEDLQRYAELVAALGKAAIMDDMPDAADADYRQLAEQMIDQAGQITLAVQADNADLARQATGQLGQACVKCHDNYR